MPVAQAQAVAGPGGEGRYTTPSSDNLNWGTLGMSVYPMGKPHNVESNIWQAPFTSVGCTIIQ